VNEYLAAVKRTQISRLRITEPNDAEQGVARRIRNGDSIRKLLGSVDAIMMTDSNIGGIGRIRCLSGFGP
jgi:hypothetical protein